jgi:hypothetical protein
LPLNFLLTQGEDGDTVVAVEHEPGVHFCLLDSNNLKPDPVGHRAPPSTGEGLLQVLLLLKRKGVKPELTTTCLQKQF